MQKFLWPLKSSITRVVQGFGTPWSANTKKFHTGIDIPAPHGEEVFAAADGTITKTGNLGGDWAHYVVLVHERDDHSTAYLHIDPAVVVGQKCKAGDVIGSIADIPGSHLHFNIWRGSVNQTLTQRGALPRPEHAGKITPKTDPEFPCNFLDPSQFCYHYKDDEHKEETTQPASSFPLRCDLMRGNVGPEVTLLQQILNRDSDTRIALRGSGSPGNETKFFGKLTEKSVQLFQMKYSIASVGTPGFGIVGPKTRAKLEEIYRQHVV
jgi:hypothetical protein